MTDSTPVNWRALCAELVEKYDLEWRARERIKTALAQPEPQGPTDKAWQEFIEQVQQAQHVAIREGECPRFDLVECALALWREAIPPVSSPASEQQRPTDEELPLMGS